MARMDITTQLLMAHLAKKYALTIHESAYPTHPIGKGIDRTWRVSRRASSLRSRAYRRKGARAAKGGKRHA